MKVSRVLHAGYIFEHEGTRLLFDPIFENPFSRNCFAYPEVRFDREAIRRERFDAVFLSHYHDDHCSFASLDLLDRETPLYMYCLHEEMFDLLRELGFRNAHPVRLRTTTTVGPFRVTTWPALDVEVDAVFAIEAGGRRVLNVVDAWLEDSTVADLGAGWDLVLWPFQTMRESAMIAPEVAEPAARGVDPEAVAQLRALRPRFVVPSSCQFIHEPWSWYRKAFFPITYARFAAEVPNVRRVEPGETFALNEGFTRTGRLSWVHRTSEELVDYEYDPVPMSTAEVARHLPPLTPTQLDRVDRFCRSLDARDWSLRVYDHDGKELRYDFASGEKPWVTEVPAFTLYGALEEGESLSSMYVRIRDHGEADWLEDPLLCALFNGRFGSYQKAQLLRAVAGREPGSRFS